MVYISLSNKCSVFSGSSPSLYTTVLWSVQSVVSVSVLVREREQ